MTREILLLVEKCSHAFSFYDIDSGERLHSVALPDYPHEFVVSPDRRFAYVGHYGVETSGHRGAGGHSLLMIDLEQRAHVRTIDLAPFNRLHGLRIDRHGRLYALAEEKGVLLAIDRPETADAPDIAVPSGGIKSHLFALSEDGETAYCMNLLSHTVTKVKPRDGTVAPVAISPGRKPEGCCLSADEATLYVTCRLSGTLVAIDTATMTVRGGLELGGDPTRIYRLPDDHLIVTGYGDNRVDLVTPDDLRVVATIPTPARPIALSTDAAGKRAFLSLDNGTLAYVDLAGRRIERTITTQLEPDVSFVLTV